MSHTFKLVQRYPLVAFFALAHAGVLSLALLARISLGFGFLALFTPAAAALIITACVEGRAGVRALLARATIWRVGPHWYLIALGLPAVLSLGASGLSLALGAPADVRFSELSALTLLLFVLVIGEELGWRGFALPRLQARYGPLGASAILGTLWATWHLPNQLIPGLEHYGDGFPAFALYVLPMTVLFTWLANRTGGSVLLAWLFHGAINGLIFVNHALDIVERWWLSAAVYGLAALLVIIAGGLGRIAQTPAPAVDSEVGSVAGHTGS